MLSCAPKVPTTIADDPGDRILQCWVTGRPSPLVGNHSRRRCDYWFPSHAFYENLAFPRVRSVVGDVCGFYRVRNLVTGRFGDLFYVQ